MNAQARIDEAIDSATQSLTGPGDWLTGEQRRAAWLECRDAATNELDQARRAAISPSAVDGAHEATELLPAEAVEVLHRIASDPGRLTQSWADATMEAIGDTVYTELVGIAALSAAVETYAWALEGAEAAIPVASAGEPAAVRPDTVGEVGAWVPQTVSGGRANVSRSLSLVPETNMAWVRIVDSMYSRSPDFDSLDWSHRALSRPQVELVAARTTAEMECFY